MKIPFEKKTKPIVETIKIAPTFLLHIHEIFDLQLQCIGVIINYIKINFCLKSMRHTNTYMELNIVFVLVEEENATKDISTHCFGFA
jgi:hypothetical protein